MIVPKSNFKLLKSFFILLSTILVGFVIIFFILEIVVRILVPQEQQLFMADPYIRSIHTPNIDTVRVMDEYQAKIHTNAQGFVGRDFIKEKDGGTYRIAVIGDSFAEGFDVDFDKTFSALLEDLLNKADLNETDRSAKVSDYQVYNFGMSNFGPRHELLTYENYAREYNPDLIIWQIYIGNDLADELLLRSDPGDTESPTATEAHTGSLRAFLSNNSQSLRFFIRELQKIETARALMTKYNIISRLPDHYDHEREYPFFYDIYNASEQTVFTENFPIMCDFVDKFKTATKNNGSKLIILVIPTRKQVIDEEWNKVFAQYPEMKNKIWDRLQPLIKLRSCLDQQNVAYIDMYPILKKGIDNGGDRMYYRTDLHLNPFGHEIVAKSLFEKISEQNKLIHINDAK